MYSASAVAAARRWTAGSLCGEEIMIRTIAGIRVAIAALLLSIPVAARAQTSDVMADKAAVDKLMHDYIETFSRGDITAMMNFVGAPLTITDGGFKVIPTADEVQARYTALRDGLVKQGYAKSQWIDFGVKLLAPSYAIAGGTYVRYKTDGSELGRSGGTYLLGKVDGVWKIRVVIGYSAKDAFKPE
jgi:hypothetical protein